MTNISKLKELLDAATPGPWSLSYDSRHNRLYVVASTGDYMIGEKHRNIIASDGDYAGSNNFKSIVAMRNALPELLAVVEAARPLMEKALEVATANDLCGEDDPCLHTVADAMYDALQALDNKLETA
jgi:hypothetical protein